jgi:hypothetical protein
MAMMNKVNICPTVGSGAVNLLKAIKLMEEAARMSSEAISIPTSVLRVTNP